VSAPEAEVRLEKAEAVLREVMEWGCETSHLHGDRTCQERFQTWPTGYCAPCYIHRAYFTEEVAR
jgi:hypothetical protein